MKKLRLYLITILLLLNFFSIENVISKTNKPLEMKDFEIGGLKIEMSISDVIKKYGKPRRIEPTQVYRLSKYHSNWDRYCFPGIYLEVGKPELIVYHILIEKKGLKTARGIGIGDSLKKVIAAYGKTEGDKNMLNYQMYDPGKDYSYCLDFIYKKDIITGIKIYYASNY